MKNRILFLTLVLTILLISFYSYKEYNIPPTIAFEKLTLTDLEGNPTSLQNYAGKNIFISMWAPWCRDCLEEMPALQFVKEQLIEEDFVFLAISDYDIKKEKQFSEKFPYEFDYLHLTEKFSAINIHAIPTNYIINKNGNIVYQKVGAEDNWLSYETIQKIKNLVK